MIENIQMFNAILGICCFVVISVTALTDKY